MSLIGSLEQFDIGNVLRRIEVFAKTGVILIKQKKMWVELHFRQGQLICIGPMRTNATLIDRLLQAQLISSQMLPKVLAVLSSAEANETRIAVTLIDQGYLSHEMLRTWAAQEATQVLRAVFSWPQGDIYFEENQTVPSNRLLVALSIATLLDGIPASALADPTAPTAPVVQPKPASMSAPSTNEPITPPTFAPFVQETPAIFPVSEQSQSRPANVRQISEPLPAFTTSSTPTGLFSASQLIDETAFGPAQAASLAKSEARTTVQLVESTPAPVAFSPLAMTDTLAGHERNSATTRSTLIPPKPIANPLPPRRIDTSFMTSELILATVNLSSLRERNPQIQLTPEQWRLFALIDGNTSLRQLSQLLKLSSERVCSLAGELLAIGLLAPLTQAIGTGSGPLASGGQTNPRSRVMKARQYAQADYLPLSPSTPFMSPGEAQGQWDSASVHGDWMLASPQSVPQTHQPGPVYAQVSGHR